MFTFKRGDFAVHGFGILFLRPSLENYLFCSVWLISNHVGRPDTLLGFGMHVYFHVNEVSGKLIFPWLWLFRDAHNIMIIRDISIFCSTTILWSLLSSLSILRRSSDFSLNSFKYMFVFLTRGHFWPAGIVFTCVCPCVLTPVCPCVNKFVWRITHHPFKLGSPNMDQSCKIAWLRSMLFWGAIDDDLQGQI